MFASIVEGLVGRPTALRAHLSPCTYKLDIGPESCKAPGPCTVRARAWVTNELSISDRSAMLAQIASSYSLPWAVQDIVDGRWQQRNRSLPTQSPAKAVAVVPRRPPYHGREGAYAHGH